MDKSTYPLRAEEIRLLHALFLARKRIRECHELDCVITENFNMAIDVVFDYFIEFMMQGIEENSDDESYSVTVKPKPA
jgi:hypothetical protein